MHNVKFPPESDNFYRELKETVHNHLTQYHLSKYGNERILSKGLFLMIVIILVYSSIYVVNGMSGLLLTYILLGPLSIILSINVVHDAAHGIAHKNKRINDLLMIPMDILGGNSYMWKRRHKVGHHAFPNIVGKDPDLSQSKIAKIIPSASKIPINNYQYLYMPFLYALYTLNWILFRDFMDFFHPTKKFNKIPRKEYLKLLLFKAMYVAIFIGIPSMITHFSITEILLSFLAMHVASSYFLTVALVPSHVSDQSEFPLPDKDGMLPYSWSHHQVHTTTDFATKSVMWTWLLGGFNHHIVHHLFPNISHVHYEAITPIAKKIIIKYGLPYQHQESLLKAYAAHYRLIKKNALS